MGGGGEGGGGGVGGGEWGGGRGTRGAWPWLGGCENQDASCVSSNVLLVNEIPLLPLSTIMLHTFSYMPSKHYM